MKHSAAKRRPAKRAERKPRRSNLNPRKRGAVKVRRKKPEGKRKGRAG